MKPVQRLATLVSLQMMLGVATTMILASGSALAQGPGSYSKAVVEDHIKKVEDGVDEFRKYLEKRGEDVKNNGQAAQNSEARRGRAAPANTEARKDQANRTKDELDNALDDLNGATNRSAPQIQSYLQLHGDKVSNGRRDGIGAASQSGDG